MNATVVWNWGMPIVDVSMNLDEVRFRLADLEVLYNNACSLTLNREPAIRNFWDVHGTEYTALVTTKNLYDALNKHFEIQLANARMALCPSVDCPSCYFVEPDFYPM